MSPAIQSLLVFVGAGVGANARYWLSALITARWHTFPWATLTINVSGSLLLGVLLGSIHKPAGPDTYRLLLGVGFLGGYTTFSTFSVEAVQLIRNGHVGEALLYGLASTCISIAAAYAGYALARG